MVFSEAQQAASQAIARFVRHPERYQSELLLWAVTGAGKTETIFAALYDALSSGKHVLIATPRKDVVLELTPRLQRAFPQEKLISLHADSDQKGEIGRFVIATTHQALNFYRYFDLVILDEADAYPYHNNPMLIRAVAQARRVEGQQIYLTATPSADLVARAKDKTMELVTIPVRHHGYPLVMPKVAIEPHVHRAVRERRMVYALRRFVDDVLRTKRQAFVFVPKIEWVTLLVQALRAHRSTPAARPWVEGTYANDPARKQKIDAFRSAEITILVTTTILERGVTIPATDCLIYSADAPIFDEHALIQMAGRVGRSTDDPGGKVVFLAQTRTAAMKKALSYITEMNALAFIQGFLHPEYKPSYIDRLRILYRRLWRKHKE